MICGHGIPKAAVNERGKARCEKQRAQTVEKPLTGFSDKFLQSAARTPCSPMANNSHCDALRAACGGCALHSAAALDLQPEMYFLSGTRPDRK